MNDEAVRNELIDALKELRERDRVDFEERERRMMDRQVDLEQEIERLSHEIQRLTEKP